MLDRTADISGDSAPLPSTLGRLSAAGLGAFFRPTQAEAAGITRDELRTLVRRGDLQREGRGLLRMADAAITEHYSLAMASARVPASIVCLLSALRVHSIGSQAPAEIWLAIPHKARVPRLPELQLRIVRFSGIAATLGVHVTQFEGVRAHITSPARTVVDCFRYERLVGAEAAMEAFRDSISQRITTVAEISRIAELLPSRRLSAALDLHSI